MKTSPEITKALKALAGKREADRRAESAAAAVAAAADDRGLLDVALGVTCPRGSSSTPLPPTTSAASWTSTSRESGAASS